MNAADQILVLSRDPRFSPYAMSAIAAWLWAPDASRVLWTNATGAALLGAATPAALAEQSFDAEHPVAAEIARLAGTLAGWPRLEKLRAIAANFTGNCSRVSLPGGGHGILVIASDPTRPALPLAERAERLFAPGTEPVAVFSAEGALLYATGELGADATLATLGADSLKTDAIASGHATGESAIGPLSLTRLGSGTTTVLVATLPSAAETAAAADAEPAPQSTRTRAGVAAEAPQPPAPPWQPNETGQPAVAPRTERPKPPQMLHLRPKSMRSSRPSEAPPSARARRGSAARRTPRYDGARRCASSGQTTRNASRSRHRAFVDAMGPRTAAAARPAVERDRSGARRSIRTAASLRALASRDTWSGVTVAWPVEETRRRLTVELSGLPIFERDRSFRGYRGFGVCRDGDQIAVIADRRAEQRRKTSRHRRCPLRSSRPRTRPRCVLGRAARTSRRTMTADVFAPPEPRPQLTIVPAIDVVRSARPRALPRQTPGADPGRAHRLPRARPRRSARASPPRTQSLPPNCRPPAAKCPRRLPPHGPTAAVPRPDPRRCRARSPRRRTTRRRCRPARRARAAPVGVLVHRADELLYANRAFLEWTGYADLATALGRGRAGAARGRGPGAGALDRANGTGKTFTIATRSTRHAHLSRAGSTPCRGRARRADAGAGAHRGRRSPQGLRPGVARRRSRDARAQVDPRHRDRRRDRGRPRRPRARRSTAAPRRCSATKCHEMARRALHRAVRAGERAPRSTISTGSPGTASPASSTTDGK